MKVKQILLVDDSPRDVELTLEALATKNLANDVVVLNDGAEALEYLFRTGSYADREPDLPAVMLLDIKMPRVDGLEVLRRVRAEPSLAELPIVLVTSSREDRDLAEAYRSGVNAYVVKPVDVASFIHAVATLGVFWAILNEPPLSSPASQRPRGGVS